MGDSIARIKKFLEDETNFTRYQITGFEYDRGKRILSEITQAKPNDLAVFLPIHERWVSEKFTANARRPFHQLHYVVRGRGVIKMSGVAVQVKRGDVYCGIASEDMEYRTDPDDPFEIYSFAFTGILQDEFVRRSGFDRDRIAYGVRDKDEAERRFCAVYDAMTTYGSDSYTTLGTVYSLFGMLERENGIGQPRTLKERYAYQAAELVRENFHATVADIASECAVSTEYLSRVCREIMGISVKELITVYRMKIATNWLRYTSITIKQAAEEVGYSNKKYFVRAFRKIFGMTPAQYRQKERENILKWSTSSE
mgnify:FL=1